MYSYTVPSLVESDVNKGISSIPGKRFKSASIKLAEQKMLVVEENNDPSLAIADDGRWVPDGNILPGNVLSGRHGIPLIPKTAGQNYLMTQWQKRGRAVVALADGHVEMVNPEYGTKRLHYDATYVGP